MAQVIEGGSDVFDALLYGRPHPGTLNFIQNHAAAMTSKLTATGQQFYNSINSIYSWVNESEAAELARRVARKVRSVWERDEIQTVATIEQFQQAPLVMHRWIMADPEIRPLFHKQQCDGFSDTYRDKEPGLVGEAHYDYRRVMDGVVQFTDKGWEATTYFEELLPDDVELTLDEQSDIQESWVHLRAHLSKRKDDPTNPRGGSF